MPSHKFILAVLRVSVVMFEREVRLRIVLLILLTATAAGSALVIVDNVQRASKTVSSTLLIEDDFQRTITRTVRARYAVRLPEGYNTKPNTNWPLILFLHGAGDRGADLSSIHSLGPMGYAQRTKGFPFIVAAPLCPKGKQWSPDVLDALLDELKNTYRIDSNRVYLTGFSLGGTGTWALAMEHPKRFAAIAPLCGRAIPVLADRLRNMPVWVFHGDEDENVPFENSRLMVSCLKNCGNLKVKFTAYSGVGHAIWEETYSNQALYDWFLGHKRN